MKKTVIRLTYIILGLVLSVSLSGETNRNYGHLLTEETIKEIENKALDDIQRLKQLLTGNHEEKYESEINRLETLNQKIKESAKTAVEKANEMQVTMEQEEPKLQSLITNEKLKDAKRVLDKYTNPLSSMDIMIKENSEIYKKITDKADDRNGVKMLIQCKEICSKLKKLSELFQKRESVEEAENTAEKEYIEALNTEQLKYIEESERFFVGLSNTYSIKEGLEFKPTAANIIRLQRLYEKILPSVLTDSEQVEKYTQGLENMKKNWNMQPLANIIFKVFRHNQDEKNKAKKELQRIYDMELNINLQPQIEIGIYMQMSFCIIPVQTLMSKVDMIKLAAISLLEMLQSGIDDPSTATEEQIISNLQNAAKNLEPEWKKNDYKILCKLLGQEDLDENTVKIWYLYNISPEEENISPKTQRINPETEEPATDLEALLKYFKNLMTLQEAINALFWVLDVPYVQQKNRPNENLFDHFSSICIATDAQILILETAIYNRRCLLKKEEEQERNEQPLSYTDIANLLGLWSRIYLVHGLVTEKSSFFQRQKNIFAYEFRYSPDTMLQFLTSFATCASVTISHYIDMKSQISNEEDSAEYNQISQEINYTGELLDEVLKDVYSSPSNYRMFYANLRLHKSLWQVLLTNIKLDLKILAEKNLSEKERMNLKEQIKDAVIVMQALIDDRITRGTLFYRKIGEFLADLGNTVRQRTLGLKFIYEDFVKAISDIFSHRALLIEVARKAKAKAEDSEKTELERFILSNLTQTVGEITIKMQKPSLIQEILTEKQRRSRRRQLAGNIMLDDSEAFGPVKITALVLSAIAGIFALYRRFQKKNPSVTEL